MRFSEIIGHAAIKQRLINSVLDNRVPHAQMLCGSPGSEKMSLALAYAQYVNCPNRTNEDSCGVCPSCLKFQQLVHPDLHFAFPIVKVASDKPSYCSDFLTPWREMLLKYGSFSINDWLNAIEAKNKEGIIYASESDVINAALQLQPYEAEYKVMIIWLPERMHVTLANKLLKIIEEPVGKTLFLLVSNQPDAVLPTILSRTQRLVVPRLEDADVEAFVSRRHPTLPVDALHEVARLSRGNVIAAESIVSARSDTEVYFQGFIRLMRDAFSPRYNDRLLDMRRWADEMASMPRKDQTSFLDYAQRLIRESFISNLKVGALCYTTGKEQEFIAKFGPFVTERNVEGFMQELQSAARDIEQNTQPKMVFFDLGLKFIMLFVHR